MVAKVKRIGAAPLLEPTHTYHYVEPSPVGMSTTNGYSREEVMERARRNSHKSRKKNSKVKWTRRELQFIKNFCEEQSPKEIKTYTNKREYYEDEVLEPNCPHGGKCFRCLGKDCTFDGERRPQRAMEQARAREEKRRAEAEETEEEREARLEAKREKKRAKDRAYKARNRERLRQQHKEWYQKRKESEQERSRANRAKAKARKDERTD